MFVVAALLSLGIALWIHELGHVLAARLAGLRVHRLAFGIGPRLLTRWPGGVEVIWRALPIWAESAVELDDPGRAPRRTVRRIAVLLAGPVASIGFGLAVLTTLHLVGTHVAVPLTVGEVQPGSEAARAQLVPGDRVEAVDGVSVGTWRELTERIEARAGVPLRLRIRRGGETLEVELIPRAEGRLGISQQYVFRRLGPGEAFSAALAHAWATVRDVTLGAITPRRFSPRGPSSGWGLDALVRAIAAVSVLLGTLHLTPVPPLDVGAALLGFVERRRPTPFSPGQRAVIQILGFVVLVGLALGAAVLRGAR